MVKISREASFHLGMSFWTLEKWTNRGPAISEITLEVVWEYGAWADIQRVGRWDQEPTAVPAATAATTSPRRLGMECWGPDAGTSYVSTALFAGS